MILIQKMKKLKDLDKKLANMEKVLLMDEKESIKVEEEQTKGKKVKFAKIDIIDVECWKEINLKLTAEENVDELMKITGGKDDKRIKNIGCTCTII